MSAVKPLPKKAPAPSIKAQKIEAVESIESDTDLSMPEQIKKALFKAITKTNNGSMTAEALHSVTEACKGYMEIEAMIKGK